MNKPFLVQLYDTYSVERPYDWLRRITAAAASPVVVLACGALISACFLVMVVGSPLYFLFAKEPFKERDRDEST